MDSLFTQEELAKHRSIESECLVIASKNPNPLYDFWRNKRIALQRRSFDKYVDSEK